MKKFFTQKHFFLTLLIAVSFGLSTTAQPLGWTHWAPIAITEHSGSTLIDYQVKLTVNTQALIAAGQMNIDGSDIRFGKDRAGTVLFNYWIDTAINTTNTIIWVKVDSLMASQVTTIYMFYGNVAATPASAIKGTFIGPFSSTDSLTGGNNGGAASSQRSFRFSPNEDMVVTDFGKYEPTGTNRYLTLFDFNSQAILRQIQVSGPAFQYEYGVLANRMWLANGQQYLMDIYQDVSDGYFYQVSSQINPHLTYYDMRYCNSCAQNTFPTSVLTGYQYGYPDFLFYTKQNVSPSPTFVILPSCPLALVIPGSVTTCVGSSIIIGDTATGYVGPVTYHWSPITGIADTNAAITQVSPVSARTYVLTAIDSSGCQASASVHVNITQIFGPLATLAICPGSFYNFHGTLVRTPGTYYDTLRQASVAGCDSIVSVMISWKSNAQSTITTTICPGSAYVVNGHSYTSAGTFQDTVLGGGANGCDSLVTLHLSFKTVAHSSVAMSPCPGPFVWNGHIYNVAGTYYDTVRGGGANGCDSIITLSLTHLVSGHSSLGAQICPGTSFTFRGHSYSAAGTYNDTIHGGSVSGCDSISSLVLTALPAGRDTIRASTCAGVPYTFKGHNYTAAGIYGDTMHFAAANGCDSIVFLLLTVYPGPNPIISAIGTDSLTTGVFATYLWLYNNAPVTGGTHISIPALTAGSYRVVVSDANGCQDTSAVYVKYNVGIDEPGESADFKIYPNPNTGKFTLIMSGQYIGRQISITDYLGQKVLTQIVSKESEIIDMGNVSQGVYLLNIGSGSLRFTVVK